jgi:hypothetical protein
MKTFLKLATKHRAANGKVKYLEFLTALEKTQHCASFLALVKDNPEYTRKQAQYIYAHGISKCRVCNNEARWFDREERFSNWCGVKCQNSDPIKLTKQLESHTQYHAKKKRNLNSEKKKHQSKLLTRITKKQIAYFQKLFDSFLYGVNEDKVIQAISEDMKPIWFNLNHDAYEYRKLIALGKIPIRAYCKNCEGELTAKHQGGWKTYCGNICANIANKDKRLSPEATTKMIKTLRKRFKIQANIDTMQAHLMRGVREKFGVANVSQVPEIALKQSLGKTKMKTYKLGKRTVKVQGYEPVALDYLQKWFKPKQLMVASEGKVPHVEYSLKDGTHFHYPDIFIPHKNCIVEVKSTYTGWGSKRTWLKLRAKSKAAKRAGYEYVVLLFTRKHKRIKLPEKWEAMNYESLISWITDLNIQVGA